MSSRRPLTAPPRHQIAEREPVSYRSVAAAGIVSGNEWKWLEITGKGQPHSRCHRFIGLGEVAASAPATKTHSQGRARVSPIDRGKRVGSRHQRIIVLAVTFCQLGSLQFNQRLPKSPSTPNLRRTRRRSRSAETEFPEGVSRSEFGKLLRCRRRDGLFSRLLSRSLKSRSALFLKCLIGCRSTQEHELHGVCALIFNTCLVKLDVLLSFRLCSDLNSLA